MSSSSNRQLCEREPMLTSLVSGFLAFWYTLQVVGYFWEYAKALDEDGKKKLLTFITSSDRVPVGGCRNLRIVISKHGTDPTRCVIVLSCLRPSLGHP